MTENPTARCLATYTRKPHYIRSHEGHVYVHAHPRTQQYGADASQEQDRKTTEKRRNT